MAELNSGNVPEQNKDNYSIFLAEMCVLAVSAPRVFNSTVDIYTPAIFRKSLQSILIETKKSCMRGKNPKMDNR